MNGLSSVIDRLGCLPLDCAQQARWSMIGQSDAAELLDRALELT